MSNFCIIQKVCRLFNSSGLNPKEKGLPNIQAILSFEILFISSEKKYRWTYPPSFYQLHPKHPFPKCIVLIITNTSQILVGHFSHGGLFLFRLWLLLRLLLLHLLLQFLHTTGHQLLLEHSHGHVCFNRVHLPSFELSLELVEFLE